MGDVSTCIMPTCNNVVDGTVAKCPACGRRMIGSRSWRIRGWLQVACGLVILGVIGTIAYRTLPSMQNPGSDIGNTTFNGTVEQGRLILVLYALLLAFGLFALIAGVIQIVTGRRSRWVLAIALVLLVAVLVAAYAAVRSIKG